MGTVICHPSTDIAAQCSACLPTFAKTRGTRANGNFLISFSSHIAEVSHWKDEIEFWRDFDWISFHLITHHLTLGIWSYPLTSSQSDDSVYKLAVSFPFSVLNCSWNLFCFRMNAEFIFSMSVILYLWYLSPFSNKEPFESFKMQHYFTCKSTKPALGLIH